MNKSNTIQKLAEALSKAQAEMPVVRMNAQNPFLKNKYADLGAVIEASRPIMAKHGLSLSQFPTSEGDRIGVTSVLMHSSGEWMEDTIFIQSSDSKGLSVAQSAGVVISYLRRYMWSAIFGLYADEDTDGHQPEKKPEVKEKTESEKKQIAIDMYTSLVTRAKAVKIEIPALDAGWTSEQMKAAYKAQYKFVQEAEAQAKVGA